MAASPVLAAVAAAVVRQGGPTPLEFWSFSNASSDINRVDLADTTSDYSDGALHLGSCGLFSRMSDITDRTLSDMTLEAWIKVSNLNWRGQGYIGIQSHPNIEDKFSAIVYAERQPRIWVPGSSNHQRTQDVGGSAESVANDFVHVAITYRGREVQMYRNGQPYGRSYQTGQVNYPPETSQIFFGIRHRSCTGRAPGGEMDCAAIYTTALSGQQIRASFTRGCCGLSRAMNKAAVGCQFCPNGQFNNGAQGCRSVSNCQPGYFEQAPATQVSDRHCVGCSPGFYTNSINARECLPCTAGHFCPGNRTMQPCPPGTFSNGPRSSSCQPCGESSTSGAMSTECTGIRPGYYGAGGTDETHSVQTPCEAGYYCPGGSINRQQCPPGTFTNETQQSRCLVWDSCAPGEYVQSQGSRSSNRVCARCRGGQFSDSANSLQCTPLTECIPGSYMIEDDDDGTQDRVCHPCGQGEYTETSNQRRCTRWTVCPFGTWSPQPSVSRDRDCQEWSTCPDGQVALVAATASSDYQCATQANAECAANQFQAGTTGQDGSQMVCSALTVCRNGEFELAAPTATSNRVCDRVSVCGRDDWERQPPTSTTDRVCTELCSICGPGTYELRPCNRNGQVQQPTSCATCTACGEGTYIESPCTASTDRTCQATSVPTRPRNSVQVPSMAAEGEGNVIIDTPPSKGVYVEGINVGATLQHLIATISELSSDVNRLQQEGTNLRSKLREAEIRINGLEQQ